jgi:hypothetical protein
VSEEQSLLHGADADGARASRLSAPSNLHAFAQCCIKNCKGTTPPPTLPAEFFVGACGSTASSPACNTGEAAATARNQADPPLSILSEPAVIDQKEALPKVCPRGQSACPRHTRP